MPSRFRTSLSMVFYKGAVLIKLGEVGNHAWSNPCLVNCLEEIGDAYFPGNLKKFSATVFLQRNFFTELLWPVAFAAPFFLWYNIYIKYVFNKLCVQHDCIEQYYQTDNLVASHSLFLKALFARISKKELIRWEQCCSYPIILFWMVQLIRMVYIYTYTYWLFWTILSQ